MKKITIPIIVIIIFALLMHFSWPSVRPYAHQIVHVLATFKTYSAQNPYMGYAIFIIATSSIIMCGVPLSTALMLLAGIVFSFWEATTLVMVGRFVTAMITFLLARRVFFQKDDCKPPQPLQLRILRLVESHPNLSVLLVRLAPIPDTIANYSLAAAPVRESHYAVMTLIGMIPFTLLCVSIGQQLGSISHLLRYLE